MFTIVNIHNTEVMYRQANHYLCATTLTITVHVHTIHLHKETLQIQIHLQFQVGESVP